ncbi:protein of unknown function (plasmid) [Agrobacterium pusense]|uniref:Transposase n=1 Tax=Agrobacterium pusense TaxID=648995 RepID=U4Q4D3_9HYPH|nr:protein of unknown function [Agrobacterium pusense]
MTVLSKDLHVAAVVDDYDRVLETRSFPTTRNGYRLMQVRMRTFGELQRIGVECTRSYGAGLLRYMQTAGVEVNARRIALHLIRNTIIAALNVLRDQLRRMTACNSFDCLPPGVRT